jgi:hypothetical protein
VDNSSPAPEPDAGVSDMARGGATGWSLWAADHPALGPTEAHPCSLHWRIDRVLYVGSLGLLELRLASDRRFVTSRIFPPCGHEGLKADEDHESTTANTKP